MVNIDPILYLSFHPGGWEEQTSRNVVQPHGTPTPKPPKPRRASLNGLPVGFAVDHQASASWRGSWDGRSMVDADPMVTNWLIVS